MYVDNIIVGGGPAALQCGYYFEKHKISYLILERNSICGSFFSNYPHSGRLISINKKHTGNNNGEFNLRHDWNSLLTEDGFRFINYSDDFYPKRDCLVSYLNDYAIRYNIKIKYNTDVNNINKLENTEYELIIKNSKEIYRCKNLIIATGLSRKIYPDFILEIKDEIKHYGDYPNNFFLQKENLTEFINKKTLIIGGGNASYELANLLNEVASSVSVFGRSRRELASISHYSGDIRSIYLPFLDTFFLKSLNAFDKTFDMGEKNKIIQNDNGNYNIFYSENNKDYKYYENGNYDKIIFCTGWGFDTSIFNFNIELIKNKYPCINKRYESIDNKNLYFIGALMHSHDFRKSSGGFIHGFRYLIKNFIHLNYDIEFESNIFKINNGFNELITYILYRINNSSAMYQMFGYIGDIIYFNKKENQYLYYVDVPINNFNKKLLDSDIIYFIITLEYGETPITDLMRHGKSARLVGNQITHLGNENIGKLIHPIIKIYNNDNILIDIIHLDENIYAEFKEVRSYYDRLKRIFKSYL